jgi:DNA end-binding protein Ku
MPARVFWKGHLKLSLVTCAVSLAPATSEGGKLRFRTLNAQTGHPVRSEYVDATTGAVVPDEAQVKAFRKGEDDYVILEDEELDEVALESTHTIDIDLFTEPENIAWTWYDQPHYLMPDDDMGAEAFAVIRDAMAATGTVGVARIVLYRRERALLLKPCKPGIIAWTLRYGEEVRPPPEVAHEAEAEEDEVTLIASAIARRKRRWDGSLLQDPVQRELEAVIAQKRRRGQRTKGTPKSRKDGGEAKPDNVVSIMEALKRSLAKGEGAKAR